MSDSLEKWYWWTYLQGRNRDTDGENSLVDTVGGGKDGRMGGREAQEGRDTYKLIADLCCDMAENNTAL